ncbi:uncharacterized protein LOC135495919 [Lineus longissimus]|uniref:uncharacterized protein LOC135495919 n=1 Tax=Lineus longissimus TaxID=88925 RepID=UPI00315CB6BE
MGTYGALDFECYDTDNVTKYIVRTGSVPVIPPFIKLDLFICFDFEAVSVSMYKYWQATSVNSAINNERALAMAEGSSATIAEVCDVSAPYDTGIYSILLKNDSVASNIITCPSDLQYRFNYTYDFGGSDLCSGNSMMDNCVQTDALAVNYTYCATEMFYSSDGDLSCLYETTNGSLTYLTLFNNDVSPDGSSTYQFSCLVFSTSGLTTFATQSPQNCAAGQTDTTVSSPGVALLFTSEGSCTAPTVDPNSNQTTTTTTQATTTTTSCASSIFDIVAVAAMLALIQGLRLF